MVWPSPQDYAEAVQSPMLSFADPELQLGQVECNAIGLPRCLSGAFATVFCFKCASRKVAVRCFLSDIQDQEERYAEISKFVLSDDLSYTVAFEYLRNGIQVRGNWYPILKMEWVEGLTLGEYLEANKDQPALLGLLAGYFKQMTLDLQRAGIAHGDLQHDNIMISDTELRLVDYDGMFVPSLTGRKASELGHRNYQHPSRSSSVFDASLDNFSAWAIYASLRCLAVDPALWSRLESGSDCLLFRNADFVSPENSRAFDVLSAHADERVRRYGGVVKSLLSKPLEQVPTLEVPLHEQLDDSFFERRSMGGRNEDPPRQAENPGHVEWSDHFVSIVDDSVSSLTNAVNAQQLPVLWDPDPCYKQLSKIAIPVAYGGKQETVDVVGEGRNSEVGV